MTMPVTVAIALALTAAVVAVAPALVAVFPLRRRLPLPALVVVVLALGRLVAPLLDPRRGVLPLLTLGLVLLPTLLILILPLLTLGLILLPTLLILGLPLLAADLLVVATQVVGLALAVGLGLPALLVVVLLALAVDLVLVARNVVLPLTVDLRLVAPQGVVLPLAVDLIARAAVDLALLVALAVVDDALPAVAALDLLPVTLAGRGCLDLATEGLAAGGGLPLASGHAIGEGGAELVRPHHRAAGVGTVERGDPARPLHLRPEEVDAVARDLVAVALEAVEVGDVVVRHVVVVPLDVRVRDALVEVVAAVVAVVGAVVGVAEEDVHTRERQEEVEQVDRQEGLHRHEEVGRGIEPVGIPAVSVPAVPVAAVSVPAAIVGGATAVSVAVVIAVPGAVVIAWAVVIAGLGTGVVPLAAVVAGAVVIAGTVVIPGAVVVAGAAIRVIAGRSDVGARGQGSPADVVVAFLPGDPGRTPVVAGHPGPTDLGVLIPAAVMVGGPAVGLVGEPGPPLVAPHPVSGLIGAPARGDRARRPDPAVARALDPVPVRRQAVVEEAQVHRGVPVGPDADPTADGELGRGRHGDGAQEEEGTKNVACGFHEVLPRGFPYCGGIPGWLPYLCSDSRADHPTLYNAIAVPGPSPAAPRENRPLERTFSVSGGTVAALPGRGKDMEATKRARRNAGLSEEAFKGPYWPGGLLWP